jgi:antitoxin (DNA-binding transcriptional repressor) of toxin-antitoxin stability system
MLTVNMLDAKTSLSRLVDAIERGVEQEVVIARNGRPAARLVAVVPSQPGGRRIGVAKGRFVMPESVDDSDGEVARLFGVE